MRQLSHAICLAVAFTKSILFINPDLAVSADAGSAPGSTPRVVNVTSDSEHGWIPSVALEQQAVKTAMDFLADMDKGAAAEAYAFLADLERKEEPFPAFSDDLRKFNKQAGSVVERRIATITWTKNPANAPIPGIYVSLDQVSRFANIDRHCGYLVLYQAPSGGNFRVMRRENNFMDNGIAADMAKRSSPAAVDAEWANVSSHCPGYKPPLRENPASSIGYPSVDAALEALHSKPGVKITNQGGWTVAEDSSNDTFWSFPPPGNPAYPSAVRRQFVTDANGTSLQMTVQCDASKDACDELVRSFQRLNAEMTSSLRNHH
jgi:hypothetical protein